MTKRNKNKTELTQKQLKEILEYDPETGVFIRLKSYFKSKIGKPTGTCTKHTRWYVLIDVYGTMYYGHRLAFLYMDGVFPPEQVDHINHDRNDNSWENLRHCDALINQNNSICNNKVVGVCWFKHIKKWAVYGQYVNGKQENLGYYVDYDEAVRVRKEYEADSDEYRDPLSIKT